jgi:OOP family OmpA-OmpF porin
MTPNRRNVIARGFVAVGALCILAGAAGCATKGYVRKHTRAEMEVLESRLGVTERAATRAGDEARTAHERALDAAFQAQLARDIALGKVRREEVRGVTVNFPFDSAEITSESEGELDGIVADLKSNPNYMALISGYTDATGSDDYNRGLAQRRANAVQLYLAERLGNDFVRVATIGFGEILPVADNESVDGRRRNRRAEISLVRPVPLSEAENVSSERAPGQELKETTEKPVF